ncbi:nuclear transport factor 2 family protein [Roseomonas sp. HJA6]|uniref:Nuclear transport factor 2 family protein n=1 Tax=Roseomonas alba TaxID=2846776 RepID=A0ABS7A4K2_9PROT|nr:nuclear transport factor 2 family protein [Neoroseomonas alba]MBW6397118.1 nuclear transport factor 2 family protein [Neoroseomonas alba]
MLAPDVARLEALVADVPVFVDQAGAVHGKGADLALHASGQLALDRIDLTERQILPLPGGDACIGVRADIAGRYAGNAFAGAFRYSPVGAPRDGAWQGQAAQCTGIAA